MRCPLSGTPGLADLWRWRFHLPPQGARWSWPVLYATIASLAVWYGAPSRIAIPWPRRCLPWFLRHQQRWNRRPIWSESWSRWGLTSQLLANLVPLLDRLQVRRLIYQPLFHHQSQLYIQSLWAPSSSLQASWCGDVYHRLVLLLGQQASERQQVPKLSSPPRLQLVLGLTSPLWTLHLRVSKVKSTTCSPHY